MSNPAWNEKIRKMRREFTILIDRCGCSRASTHITKKEAKEMTKLSPFPKYQKVKPCEPSCTPKRCFPTIYTLLYPKGGFHHVSYHVQSFRKRKKQGRIKK